MNEAPKEIYVLHFCILEANNERLDTYLISLLPFLPFDMSRTQLVPKLLTLKINNTIVKKSHAVQASDEIYVEINVSQQGAVTSLRQDSHEHSPLDPSYILYEDQYLLVVNKPAGMVVHPGAGNLTDTLSQKIFSYLDTFREEDVLQNRAGIVHRLDKDTTGVILIAKTARVHEKLSKLFASREIKKQYLALVHNIPQNRLGKVENFLGRHSVYRKKYTVVANPNKGKLACTQYCTLATNNSVSLVLCEPQTGRTHQIRVHMHFLSCPIVGDTMYSMLIHDNEYTELLASVNRVMLHAYKLSFTLRIKDEIKNYEFTAPLASDMETLLDTLEFSSSLKNMS